MKYQAFYPENNKPASPIKYDTLSEIVERYSEWERLWALGEKDLAAFLNQSTGDVVVIREVDDE